MKELSQEYFSRKRIFAILAIIVCFEAILIVALTKDAGIIGGDGPEYNNLAVNMLDNGIFSNQGSAPLEPSIARTPGFPAFLSLVYSLTGNSIIAVRLAQFFLLLLTAYLLYLAAEKFVGGKAAFWSAIFCATYLPLVFFCLYHLTETISTFLVALAIQLTTKLSESKYLTVSVALGAVMAYLSLVRPSFGLFAGGILLIVLLSGQISFKKRITCIAVISVLILVSVGLWGLRNLSVSGSFIPLGTVRGISLYVSAQQYKGEISYGIPNSDWVGIIKEANDRYAESRRIIESQASEQNFPANVSLHARAEILQDKTYTADAIDKFKTVAAKEFLFSYPKRIVYLFSTSDSAPESLYNYVHRVVQLQYLVLCLLILVGLFVYRKSLLKQYALWLPVVYLIVIHTVFHIEPRYSMPAKPFLLIYAGAGMCFLIEKFRRKQIDSIAATAENI